jgi:ABC-type multidrug transport system ATPase subunit
MLWACILRAKKTRAVLLTTHSMEEAGEAAGLP